MRYFRYVGTEMLTRGEYGVRISGGHTTEEDPDGIYVFDPDCGEMYFCRVGDPEFVEVSREEHARI